MQSFAAAKRLSWGVSPFLGAHNPSLKKLTGGEYSAPMPGRGRLELPVTGDNINFDFIIDNTLSSDDWGANSGVEFQWLLNDHNQVF